MPAELQSIETLDPDGREELEARDWLAEQGQRLDFENMGFECEQPAETDNLKRFKRRSGK
jgi:hypothetical protein